MVPFQHQNAVASLRSYAQNISHECVSVSEFADALAGVSVSLLLSVVARVHGVFRSNGGHVFVSPFSIYRGKTFFFFFFRTSKVTDSRKKKLRRSRNILSKSVTVSTVQRSHSSIFYLKNPVSRRRYKFPYVDRQKLQTAIAFERR